MKMNLSRRSRLLAAGCIALLALSATLFLSEPTPSMAVDELMKSPSKYDGEELSIRGVVVNGSYDSQNLLFSLEGADYNLSIDASNAAIPQAFGEGLTILVDGTLVKKGALWVLEAELLTVGCPSKYE
jgi:cytochrome c-type biogenesis protein CcmE|tara:strand:+ start:21 stop:404 length:384 start_codon:yes stop_codon:yes gene_type:complete